MCGQRFSMLNMPSSTSECRTRWSTRHLQLAGGAIASKPSSRGCASDSASSQSPMRSMRSCVAVALQRQHRTASLSYLRMRSSRWRGSTR
eukprot:13031165-Alexandrium_andersonii.AAC.1